jgi:amidase
VPASHCGLIGLRPTHGRVSLAGVMDLARSFDTCGWFARDMDVFARAGDVLLGEDSAPCRSAAHLVAATCWRCWSHACKWCFRRCWSAWPA